MNYFLRDFSGERIISIPAASLKQGYPHIHSYQKREKRSKKEKATTTILISLRRTTMIIIGTAGVIAYTL
jgi:hypothetical protein